MRSGLFGPRGPSNSYYVNNYSNNYSSNYPMPASNYSTNYPNYASNPLTNGYAPSQYSPSYENPYFNTYPRSGDVYQNMHYYPNHSPSAYKDYSLNSMQTLPYISWGRPDLILTPKGLQTILVATLVLVALDLMFVRPLKRSMP